MMMGMLVLAASNCSVLGLMACGAWQLENDLEICSFNIEFLSQVEILVVSIFASGNLWNLLSDWKLIEKRWIKYGASKLYHNTHTGLGCMHFCFLGGGVWML